ncbi:MAG: SSU ribosomal protein S11p (S14e), partial [uncultured Acidimicrobiales bacterium]
GQAQARRSSPPPQGAQERLLRGGAHQVVVQQHDHQHHRPVGQRPGLGLGRQRRLQGVEEVDALRRPDGRRAVRPAGDGARRPQGRRPREGPGVGPGDRHPLDHAGGHRGVRHQGRHAHAAQRVPPPQAPSGL